MAALGHDAGVVSRVGDDDAGDTVVDSLTDWDVDASGVHRGEDATSYTLVLRGPDGDRMIVAGGDSVPGLALTDAAREALRDADCVFTSAYAPDAVVRELVDMRENGDVAALVFDLAGPLPELEGRGATPETIDAAAEAADLFVANEVAARSYLDTDPESAARALASRGADRVAVTAGAEGAFLATAEETIHVPALDVDAVDATGAGDAFTAALVHAWLLGGENPARAGRTASAAAAQNCTAEGARGALPTRDDLSG
jgi:ribokinase/sulfofructose kinase